MRQERPIVRSFRARFSREAAAWAKRGGHSVVIASPRVMHLFFRIPRLQGDLGRWAALDLRATWRAVKRGAFRGLACARIPTASMHIARAWCERDATYEGPFLTLDLDCIACGACCFHNRVELSRADVRRLRNANLEHVTRTPFARRRADGKLALVVAKNGRCKQLERDGKCAIYTHRPDACRAFPPASEGCLYARMVELAPDNTGD
jgi:Fe-S-cluster containining protein